MKSLSARAAIALCIGFAAVSIHPLPAAAQAHGKPPAPPSAAPSAAEAAAAVEFNSAVREYRAGHLAKAMAIARDYVKTRPNDAIAWGLLGFIELKLNQNLDLSTSDLEKAVKLDPNNITNRKNLSIALVKQKKFTEALPEIEFIARAQPNDIRSQASLADELAATGQMDRAIEVASKTASMPGCPAPIVNDYALMLARANRYSEAAKQFDRTAALDPSDEQAWDSAGTCYAKAKDDKDAIRCFGEALKLGPVDPFRTRFLYATSLANTGALDAAAKQFKYVTQTKPDSFAAWYNLGILDERLGRTSDAIAAYKQAHQLSPDNSPAVLNLCGLLAQSGQTSDAIDLLSEAVQQKPSDAALHAALGSAYHTEGKNADAAAEFKAALKIDPKNNITRAKLAQVDVETKNWIEALVEYNALVQAAPDSDSLQNQRGEVLEELKMYPEALDALQEAIKLNPDSAVAWNNLGAVHEQMKQFSEAIAAYKKAEAIDPKLAEAKTNADRLAAFMKQPQAAPAKAAIQTPPQTTAQTPPTQAKAAPVALPASAQPATQSPTSPSSDSGKVHP